MHKHRAFPSLLQSLRAATGSLEGNMLLLLRYSACVMAHSKTRLARGGPGPTKQTSTRGGGFPPRLKIEIFQSIQLGFSRSLGSATSNEANKSAMRRAEWTIAARRAVLRLAQIKYRYLVPERCKKNAIFSGTNHQNKAHLDNISTNR